METLLQILIPTLLSGLGVLSYRHPRIANYFLSIIAVLATILFFLFYIYYDGKSSAFNESRSSTNFKIDKTSHNRFEIDSMNVTLNNVDSIKTIMQKNGIINDLKYKIYENEQTYRDSVKTKISILSNNVYLIKSELFKYYAITIILVLVFFFMSYVFHDQLGQNSNRRNNQTDQRSD